MKINPTLRKNYSAVAGWRLEVRVYNIINIITPFQPSHKAAKEKKQYLSPFLQKPYAHKRTRCSKTHSLPPSLPKPFSPFLSLSLSLSIYIYLLIRFYL
ncbi:hypothetical protein RJT34_25349 [Clitoria ternatea]|uniref:Uncharacterized protein n=1 Tax=Clitoria ternatea TaxID=43366 RepID=A0AAN9FPL4_CLITE